MIRCDGSEPRTCANRLSQEQQVERDQGDERDVVTGGRWVDWTDILKGRKENNRTEQEQQQQQQHHPGRADEDEEEEEQQQQQGARRPRERESPSPSLPHFLLYLCCPHHATPYPCLIRATLRYATPHWYPSSERYCWSINRGRSGAGRGSESQRERTNERTQQNGKRTASEWDPRDGELKVGRAETKVQQLQQQQARMDGWMCGWMDGSISLCQSLRAVSGGVPTLASRGIPALLYLSIAGDSTLTLTRVAT
ncbi:hypothetical protein AXG93_1962s1280 [Marchantia polymorpha subsp. ruderalis]|uniref:Uncharacterized protein n=1 Tax=Marchantia polymorpha subsp. ruderalis TaxID=1480154 RepID=A0A176WF88_MARPO|nr:hypothetical protein AXG93_1962s1280 [Marchantia polymorpha subsp. ruderalis]